MSPIVREYYRVPREDRASYIRPAPVDLAALVEGNRRLIASYDFRLAGRPFAEFRAAARAEIVATAGRYAARWGFAVPAWAEPAPLIVTGHQPPPFHPGVWIKNFLAGSLASAVGGAALNLIVDNDEARGQVLRFPTRAAGPGQEGGEARLAEVRLVDGAAGVPLEDQPAAVLRREAADECRPLLAPESAGALARFWALLEAAVPGAASAGETLSVARRRLEEALSLRNLELPVSRLADSEAFRLFVAEMLGRPEAFFAAYNESLAEYRRAYRERSPAQPVPDLGRDGPRLELPLWIWRAGQGRRRLWVEPQPGGDLALRAGGDPAGLVRASEIGDAAATAARLAALRQDGWKIRPRALALTFFVRLVLGDVFVHGLGGALYDKVTDAMIERLLGVRPPGLILASCTVHLPLETYPSTPADLVAARRALRDWRFNPDRMLSAEVRARPEAAAMVEEKRRLVAGRAADAQERRRAFHRVHEINGGLAGLHPDGPRGAEQRLATVRRHVRLNAILRNREYPFCIYPVEELARFYREAVSA